MKLDVGLVGTSPLTTLKLSPESEMPKKDWDAKVAQDGEYPRKFAELHMHKNSDGVPIVPSVMLMSCFAAGYGKPLYGYVALDNPIGIPIVSEANWEPYPRPVPIPSSKSMVIACTPTWYSWRLNMLMEIDNTDAKMPDLVRAGVEKAGRFIGLGTFRKHGYGRFNIAKWERCD